MIATVTKKSVSLIQPKLYSIIFNLILTDGANTVFNQDFSVEYHTGDNAADKVAKAKEDMQKAIDNYKAEKAILNSTALDNAVIAINGGLVI